MQMIMVIWTEVVIVNWVDVDRLGSEIMRLDNWLEERDREGEKEAFVFLV